MRERKKERKTSPRDSRDFLKLYSSSLRRTRLVSTTLFLFVVQFSFQTVERFQDIRAFLPRKIARTLFHRGRRRATRRRIQPNDDDRGRRASSSSSSSRRITTTTTRIALKISNAFGRPPRVDGSALDVFALLNLAGFRVPDERVGTRRHRRRRARRRRHRICRWDAIDGVMSRQRLVLGVTFWRD